MTIWVVSGIECIFNERHDVRIVLGAFSSKDKAINSLSKFLADGYFDIDVEPFCLDSF